MEPAAEYTTPSHPAMPIHVAIIMDGNGRWAESRNLPRIAGYQQGAEAVRRTVIACRELGVAYLTIYAFSSENWKRPPAEVDDLMALFSWYLRRELMELTEQNVRIRFIGDRERLPPNVIALIEESEAQTRDNTAVTLTVAVNYGGRNEIVSAARRVAEDAEAGRLDPGDITEQTFRDRLETSDLPDPDLLIRTSGEQRLSNFLLWQSAYTELIFLPTLWPDFNKHHLEEAIHEFQRRERRYGGTNV